jgi:hypothetical protein
MACKLKPTRQTNNAAANKPVFNVEYTTTGFNKACRCQAKFGLMTIKAVRNCRRHRRARVCSAAVAVWWKRGLVCRWRQHARVQLSRTHAHTPRKQPQNLKLTTSTKCDPAIVNVNCPVAR